MRNEWVTVSTLSRLRNTYAGIQEMLREESDLEAGMDELWYLRRLDGGLYTLQIVDYILGWICMEDDGVSRRGQ